MKNNTEINWYDLKDKEFVYLKASTLRNLIKEGENKAGSLSKLCIELGSTYFYTTLRENFNGISIKKLKDLINYLGKEYNFINDKIIEIRKGKICSIRNLKFPINLMNPKIGRLIGNIVSDGCLSYDPSRKNLIRTAYYADNKHCLDTFISNIRSVFGDVHFNKKYIRNCTTLRIGNGIVGEVLKRAGGIVGNKSKLNEGLPWVVQEGGIRMKKSYLTAIFDDEGAFGKGKFPYAILSRNIHVKLNKSEKMILNNNVIPFMKSSFFPTGHLARKISIGKVKMILEGINAQKLLNKILNSKPKMLIDESNLLKDYFGINNSTYIMALHLTSNNNYSVESCLVIRNKKDLANFYNNIGFSLTKKQNKLKQALINVGWIRNGT